MIQVSSLKDLFAALDRSPPVLVSLPLSKQLALEVIQSVFPHVRFHNEPLDGSRAAKFFVHLVTNRRSVGIYPPPGLGIAWSREKLNTILPCLVSMPHVFLQQPGYGCVHVRGTSP